MSQYYFVRDKVYRKFVIMASRLQYSSVAMNPPFMPYVSTVVTTLWMIVCSVPDILASLFYLIVPRPCKNVNTDIVMVTGAGQGIGRELCLRFANLGCSEVVCVDVSSEHNQETVRMIREAGGKARGYICDVADRNAIMKLEEEVGRVDILINNAGIYPFTGSLWTADEEQIRKIIDVNLLSQLWTTQAFLPGMKERDHGHIVSISSIVGVTGIPYMIPYSVSKAGLIALMSSLKQELVVEKKEHIRLTTVFPCGIKTNNAVKCIETAGLIIRLPYLEVEDAAKIITVGILQDLDSFTVPRGFTLATGLLQFLPASYGDKWLYEYIYMKGSM